MQYFPKPYTVGGGAADEIFGRPRLRTSRAVERVVEGAVLPFPRLLYRVPSGQAAGGE